MRYYPIFLDLRGRWCAVVGGGRVAERKVRGLLRAGSSVQVISPEVTPRLALLAAKKKIGLTPRAYRRGDLKNHSAQRAQSGRDLGPMLVFAATDDPETQRAVRKDAEALGACLNMADDIERSNFIVPASFTQGDLRVAISTSGASPALARLLRQELQRRLGYKYRAYLRFLRQARRQVRENFPNQTERTSVLRQLAGKQVAEWWWQGAPDGAAPDLRKLLAKLEVDRIRN
jgi:precorrin-2 dehydrogenase / sirohydrochlorin ferrochelatase